MPAYRMDVYHRPESGAHRPELASTHTVIAVNDDDAIAKARGLFRLHDTPSTTGFILNSLGRRRSHDTIVHNYLKTAGGIEMAAARAPATAQMAQANGASEETTVLSDPIGTNACGEAVAEVPVCIGFGD